VAEIPDTDSDPVVRAARSGEPRALEELVRRARPRIVRWAFVKTGDRDEAEDVAQEVSLTLVRRLARFEGGSFWAWLYRVTSNAVVDAQRRGGRRALRESEPRAVMPARGRDALDELIADDAARSLHRFMRTLSERQREIFDLVDMQGHTAAEAAEMLGIEASTARVHLLRARRELRTRLLEEEIDDHV
jgi:RNA polymerase sigma-70 factor (ECF subfamily)